MEKQLCVVHANCQGPPLLERLRLCSEFSERYHFELYTNYTREPIPDERLAECGLFLYQYLGPQWGGIASATLLEKLSPTARSLCIPNMFFKGYWPFWSGEPGFDHRCAHLDEIIAKGLPPRETIMLYIHSDVGRKFDLLEIVRDSLATEREREIRTPIKYVDLLVARYRKERLFNTINHPGRLLMDHVARGVLKYLGFEPPAQETLDKLEAPFASFEQPINPKVAEYFGWEFATPRTEYQIYGQVLSHARYVANYVMCAQAGISDFTGFLQGEYIELF